MPVRFAHPAILLFTLVGLLAVIPGWGPPSHECPFAALTRILYTYSNGITCSDPGVGPQSNECPFAALTLIFISPRFRKQAFGAPENKNAPAFSGGHSLDGRRGRDSNPRYSCPYNGFRDRPIRPLWHPSGPPIAWILQWTANFRKIF